MNPYEYLNEINYGKKDSMTSEQNEKDYVPFLINRSLSYFQDTVGLSNVMNQYHFLDKKLQFHFLINTVRKRKRFSKWDKPDEASSIEVIKEYYGYSNEKARQALKLLTSEQIKILNEKVYKGGRK